MPNKAAAESESTEKPIGFRCALKSRRPNCPPLTLFPVGPEWPVKKLGRATQLSKISYDAKPASHCPRLFRGARHVHRPALPEGQIQLRSHRLLCEPGAAR